MAASHKQLNRPVLTSRADLAEAVVQRANEAEILDAARQFGLGGFSCFGFSPAKRPPPSAASFTKSTKRT